MFLLLLLLLFSAPTAPAQEAAGETNATTVTTNNAAGDARTGPVTLPTRLWKNFSLLITELVEPFAIATAKLFGLTLLAGAAGFFVGGIMGFLLWYWLRKRGLLDAPFRWYRFFKWMWAPLFPVCAALGLGYAAAWLEAGHIVKAAITRDRLVERTVASVYAAVALDTAKHELTGRETMAEVQEILQQADELSQVLNTNLGALLLKNFQAPEVQRAFGLKDLAWLTRLAETKVGRLVLKHATNNADARLVLLTFYAIASGDEAKEEYLKSHPKAATATALVRDYLQRVNRELVRLVNWLVYPQAAIALLTGFGAPLLLAGMFRLAARMKVKDARAHV